MNTIVFSITVHNNAGVLNRVASLFSKRDYNIDSLSVGPSETKELSRITVVSSGDLPTLVQIEKQLRKLEDVVSVVALEPNASVYRELVLIKVEANHDNRADIVQIVDIFRAKVVDVSIDSMIIEVTGTHSKIDSIITMLEGFNITEITRTGLTGMSRGLGDLNINNK